MFSRIREFFWPILDELPDEEKKRIKKDEESSIEQIQNTDWSTESELALDEAHRIASEEEGRVKTAESKATNLLLFAGALIPLLIYLEKVVLGTKEEMIPPWISLLVLAISIAYLVKASSWAFRTIDVGNYNRIYSEDLIKIWPENKVRESLVVKTLVATRKNQETINSKVSALKLTHAFLLRAIVSLSVLVFLQVIFKVWSDVKQPILMFYMICRWIY